MKTNEKKEKIKALVTEMLKQSHEAMIEKIDRVLNSGAIDIDGWDEKQSPMIVPKCIISALYDHQITQFDGSGTTYERRIKKEIRNIRYFIPG
jgi:hypothetical protein